jgi:nicotinamidase-related amidase
MRNLLIIIDLQKGWRHRTATEATMLQAVELAKTFDGDVIHCRFRNDPESLFYTQLRWRRFVEAEDTDEIPEIAALKLPTYWRSTYSCVTDELLPVLRDYDHVYIAGVFTDISVHATALAIFDKNITVSVVADCVATLHGENVHEQALRSIEHAIDREHVVAARKVPWRH